MINRLSQEQQSWLASIVVHVLVLSVLSVSFVKVVKETEQIIVPVELVMVQPKKVAPKQPKQRSVSKKAMPVAKTVPKPTSLPGDRKIPLVSSFVDPIYPKQALNNDWEGTVKVRVGISNTGSVNSVRVLRSSGHTVLDQAFIKAIKNYYKFKPKRSMGKDVAGSLVLAHSFSLGV
jgi:protein TonB